MRLTPILAALILATPAALAQSAGPQTPPAPTQTPDIGAKLHHQPTEVAVTERERARDGDAAVDARQRREQKQVDTLYRQLIGRSPTAGGQ